MLFEEFGCHNFILQLTGGCSLHHQPDKSPETKFQNLHTITAFSVLALGDEETMGHHRTLVGKFLHVKETLVTQEWHSFK